MQIEIISNSPVFTRNLGKRFSKVLSKGDIVLFTGELGGGKTTFISGLAEGFGLGQTLSSPSFTIMNEYLIDNTGKFIHADLYRLERTGDINEIGLEDYFYDGVSIICVEWGDRIKDNLVKDYLEINFSYLIDESNTGTNRKIIFTSLNRYWDNKLSGFEKIMMKDGK